MKEINHLSVHQWLRSAIRDSQQPSSPIGFLFLKLPPPPCAVLLVWTSTYVPAYLIRKLAVHRFHCVVSCRVLSHLILWINLSYVWCISGHEKCMVRMVVRGTSRVGKVGRKRYWHGLEMKTCAKIELVQISKRLTGCVSSQGRSALSTEDSNLPVCGRWKDSCRFQEYCALCM